MALTLLCSTFVVLLLLGVPVAFSIGLACLAAFFSEGLPIATAVQMMVSGMNVFSFLAIPFFIFSGELMLHGGIADKIMNFARSLTGHVRGGLGLANVLASTLFGGVSGSPVADTSAMGGVMIPLMKREGYGADYRYDHDQPDAFSGQNYWPDAIGRRKLYEPVERGFEREVRKRLDYWARLRAEREKG
jgi:TRAP-type mannitol/chloroaromatic compound transport system permease large subunit